MEYDRSSLIPSFAQGLRILLVDHDSTSLACLCSMLEQYAFKVTSTELASTALCMVQEQTARFQLVMANANMRDVDSLQFLHVLLDKNIPVILMFSQKSGSAARKAIAEGASFILHKPISIDDLKYIWQHAYRNKSEDLPQNGSCQDKENDGEGHRNSAVKETNDGISRMAIACELQGNGKDNYALTEEVCPDTGNEHSTQSQDVEMMKRRNEYQDELQRERRVKTIIEDQDKYTCKKPIIEQEVGEKSSSDRKSRVLWTPDLHLKFTAAISALGDKNARPKPILEMMNVPHLTQRQVASHLQKYKSQVRRICETGATNLPAACVSSNFYGRTRFSDSVDKNISDPIIKQGSKSSASGIIDVLPMSKSLCDFRTPNSTSSYSLQNTNQVPPGSSTGRTHDCLAGKSISGNASATGAAKFLTFSSKACPNLDFMHVSVPTPGNKSDADMFPQLEQEMDSQRNSVNIPDEDRFSAGCFNDLNEGLNTMTFPNPNAQEVHNLEKNLTGSNDLNQELNALEISGPTFRNVSNATAVSGIPANESHPPSKYADLWKMLEKEEDEGFDDLAAEANPDDVDRYCQLLANVMLGNN